MTPHNEAAARRAQSSCGSSGNQKSALLLNYCNPLEISIGTFAPIGVSFAVVIAKLAARYNISEARAKVVCELANLQGGVE